MVPDICRVWLAAGFAVERAPSCAAKRDACNGCFRSAERGARFAPVSPPIRCLRSLCMRSPSGVSTACAGPGAVGAMACAAPATLAGGISEGRSACARNTGRAAVPISGMARTPRVVGDSSLGRKRQQNAGVRQRVAIRAEMGAACARLMQRAEIFDRPFARDTL